MHRFHRWPPGVLFDQFSKVADIYILRDAGGRDGDGNPIPPTPYYFAQNMDGDLQPKTGSERAAESATVYKSSHVFFMDPVGEGIPKGAFCDIKENVGTEESPEWQVKHTFTVVFVNDWGSHLEVELEERK